MTKFNGGRRRRLQKWPRVRHPEAAAVPGRSHLAEPSTPRLPRTGSVSGTPSLKRWPLVWHLSFYFVNSCTWLWWQIITSFAFSTLPPSWMMKVKATNILWTMMTIGTNWRTIISRFRGTTRPSPALWTLTAINTTVIKSESSGGGGKIFPLRGGGG